jgi:hypothetical protein
MDGLVEQLWRLESAKHRALVSIDAPAYEATVREQMRLLGASKGTIRVTNLERLLALSQLITLNTRLFKNLVSSTPVFNFSGNGYAANGDVSVQSLSPRLSVEA